jgi:hypothetical protein
MENQDKIEMINERIYSLQRRKSSCKYQIELTRGYPEEEHFGIEIYNNSIIDYNRQINALESLRDAL